MALFKGGGLNEGSLLRRTLLHIGTFAFGALAFVTLMSFLLVTIAKSVLPSRDDKADKGDRSEAAEEQAAPAKPGAAKPAKTRKAKDAVAKDETPSGE